MINLFWHWNHLFTKPNSSCTCYFHMNDQANIEPSLNVFQMYYKLICANTLFQPRWAIRQCSSPPRPMEDRLTLRRCYSAKWEWPSWSPSSQAYIRYMNVLSWCLKVVHSCFISTIVKITLPATSREKSVNVLYDQHLNIT